MDLNKYLNNVAPSEPQYSKEEYAAMKKTEREAVWVQVDARMGEVLADAPALQEFLNFMSQCRNSLPNQLLLSGQNADITDARTFQQWKDAGRQIRRYQQELDDAKAEYAELRNARLNEAAEIRKLRTYYDDFRGWAEEFDTAPLEMKRMILSHLIDRVEVGRKYQVIVKFNMKYRQFLECTAETYNTEIGA